MFHHSKISFLQEKIMELQQALFFDLGCSVLKFPTSIVNALYVDEIGQVWFFISRPKQHINEFEKEFRSRLDFYKKGKNFYLHLSGKSCIVTDPEEINCIAGLSDEYKQLANSRMVLVRLRADHLFYYPLKEPIDNHHSRALPLQSSAFIKTLQYIVKDIIPVFQSH